MESITKKNAIFFTQIRRPNRFTLSKI